ncbi:MAG TPA: Gfo/Idh/MocA family oxidoreductase [Gaiellaceae bacterium]|nr:Gfo/Idh/MocA family oxidoreductase [Gaiellaceae bacterium]
MRFGIVGCGSIAARYADRIVATDGLELVAATDVLPGRAEELVAQFGGRAHESLAALLADDEVEAVVNLTGATAHVEVTTAALEAGKHVHSEKPLALAHADAQGLVELADSRGLLLSASPATLLGEAEQTMWKLIRDGAIGPVRVAYAEANWGHIESWHPTPLTIYAVGPAGDVGVYPLAILTAIFGPARQVTAYGATVEPDRVDRDGRPFRIETPDLVVAAIELEGGVVVRLTASFYVGPGKQRGIELHGDGGMLHLAAWSEFDSRLQLTTTGNGDDYEDVPPLRPPYRGTDWARPLVDLAEAARDGRQPRTSGAHAAHLVEILDAIDASRRDGGAVAVRSTFQAPRPMPWGE